MARYYDWKDIDNKKIAVFLRAVADHVENGAGFFAWEATGSMENGGFPVEVSFKLPAFEGMPDPVNVFKDRQNG